MNAEWPKLVRSYAAQVVGGWYSGGYSGEPAALLSQLASAWPTAEGWAGIGQRHALPLSGYSAWAVSLPGGVVHVAALPGAPVYQPPPPPPYPPRDPVYPLPEE